jgi:cobalt/nickel transport system permease protein
MHSLLDDCAHSNALRDVDPRIKLFLGLGAILISVSSASPLAPAFVALSMSIITVKNARIDARFYFSLLLIPISFSLLSAAVVAFMHGTGDLLFSVQVLGRSLGIREDGANLAILLIARTFGGMCSLFFIALTTPMIEIFSVLKSLKIPGSIIELSMMIYRYIFVFLDQASMIHTAQVVRLGGASPRSSLNSFAMLSSVLFIRAWEQGERLIVAMDSRCYDGKLELIELPEGREPRAILAVLAYLTAAAAIAFMTRNFQLL